MARLPNILSFLIVLGCCATSFAAPGDVINLAASEIVPVPSEEYQKQTGPQKLDYLWNQCLASPYPLDKLPTGIPNPIAKVTNISHLATQFEYSVDEVEPRLRYVNQYGVLVKLRFNLNNSIYTGVLSKSSIVLARFSLAQVQPTLFSPSVVLKYLVDGKPSKNEFFMDTLDGGYPNKNWFSYTLQNRLRTSFSSFDSTGRVHDAFQDTLDKLPYNPKTVTTDFLQPYDAATVNFDGTDVKRVVAPFLMTLLPNINVRIDPNTTRDFRQELVDIPAGTILYRIVARPNDGAQDKIIGEIVSESNFVACEFGDRRLMMQHPHTPWKDPNAASSSGYGYAGYGQ